ncbi:hypothetical protein G6O69_09550 [Pseudenhygromyxa sp. WMMC2535]|uniref:cytochrome-c peroxidase n=1 Tax=Pseudenhygromyxa sp. WMMC2535 TaxID=2712867 RepID=UPI001557F4EB|nr:cytochrome c peroxidase [Pseudenhygromyxa sp. WMMC2535]NVB38075.1 hypothetical protein [Pseudenhygromyxa sp. WMMC2535]
MPPAPEVREELVELGQALAFDKELSGTRDVSCMTCHHPTLSSDDNLSLSIGVGGVGLGADRVHPDGIFIPRNAPPLFNLHAMDTMFWDGRVSFHGGVESPADEELTQEMLDVFEFGVVSAQAMFPVTSREEMRGKLGTSELSLIRDSSFTLMWEALMARLAQIPEYVEMFEAAYPGTDFEDMSFAHAANAIAGFEVAAFEAADTPWDQFLRGDDWALSLDQLQGANHFLGKAKCSQCHSGASLTDVEFHNTALPQIGPGKGARGVSLTDDWGHYDVSRSTDDFYRFRTAPLRNIDLTGPWGHAGQYTSLESFIEHYLDPEASLLDFDPDEEGVDPALSDTLVANQDLVLDHVSPLLADMDFREQRLDEMVEFMHALTDPASLDLEHTIPETVPSGLPVGHDQLVVPDNYEGAITMEWGFGGTTFREYQIQEPSMCVEDTGTVTVSFDRNANTLAIDAQIKGLPYRPDLCYEYNPSTEWNAYPDCVEDGIWQMWMVPRMFNLIAPFWYDAVSGDFIDTDWVLDEPPANAFMVYLPAGQMIGTQMFDPDPETLEANVHFDLEYDRILDELGKAGVMFSLLPKNIYNPTELEVYYSTSLPEEYAMSFDDFIEMNNMGKGGLGLAVSIEPDPKPSYLDSRDNVMLGYGTTFPDLPPELLPVFEEECGTNFQWDGINMDGGDQP